MEGDNNTEVDTECGTANKSHVSIKKKKKKKGQDEIGLGEKAEVKKQKEIIIHY